MSFNLLYFFSNDCMVLVTLLSDLHVMITSSTYTPSVIYSSLDPAIGSYGSSVLSSDLRDLRNVVNAMSHMNADRRRPNSALSNHTIRHAYLHISRYPS